MNQNVPDLPRPVDSHDGYLSEEAKKRFTITAGILGAVFFFLQFLIPFVVMMLIFPVFIFSSLRIKAYDFTKAAVQDNYLYFFARETGPNARGSFKLMRLDLAKVPVTDSIGQRKRMWSLFGRSSEEQTELEEVAELPDKSVRPLADGEKLLLISQCEMWELKDGKLVLVGSYDSLGNISRPFHYEGLPAIVEGRPNGLFLAVFENGEWKRTPILLEKRDDFREADRFIQVLPINRENHVFLRVGKVIFHRIGLPLEEFSSLGDDWQSISASGSCWRSFVLDGKPAVLLQSRNGLRGSLMEGDQWSEFVNVFVDLPVHDFFPLSSADGHLRIAISRIPLSFGIYSIGEGKLILNRRYGRGFPVPSGLMAIMFIPHIANIMFPIILAFILSGLMLRHRVSSHSFGRESVPYASLIRRALAQVADGAILVAGMLPFAMQFFNIFKSFETEMDMKMFPIHFLMTLALSLVWPVILLLIFSWTEGIWGITPGKWLFGIRVVGTDLKPCGFWRGLLRNFLKVVDGFFNFMVGILVVTFTRDWQRVGDMAARTIVIRKGRPLKKWGNS